MPQRLFVLFGLLAVLVVSLSWSETGRATAAQTLEPIYPTSPDNSLMFIENVGQFDDEARFQVRGGDRTIWLAEDAIWVTILEPAAPSALPDHEGDLMAEIGTVDIPRRGVNLRFSFVGANPNPLIEVTEPVSTTISYFLGNDPAGWQPDVPVWGSVRYADLYPGLDLELVGQVGTLAPQLVCHVADCAAALTAVQLEVAGAEVVMLAGESLHISTALGEWRLPLLTVVDYPRQAIWAWMQIDCLRVRTQVAVALPAVREDKPDAWHNGSPRHRSGGPASWPPANRQLWPPTYAPVAPDSPHTRRPPLLPAAANNLCAKTAV